MIRMLAVAFATLLLLSGCQKNPDPNPKLNVKSIKKTISKRTHQRDLLHAFGEPQMAERSSYGKEIWVYDKQFEFKRHSNKGFEFLDLSGGEYFIGAGVGYIAVNLLWNSLNFKDKYKGLGSSLGALAGVSTVGFLRDGDMDIEKVENLKTLTLILEFNQRGYVSRYSYHTSQY